MTHMRWLVRQVYADADEDGRVGVLRADPAAWAGDELLPGGRVLGSVYRNPSGLYYWRSDTLWMSGSTYEPDMTVAMTSMIESFDVQNKLTLDALDPLPESGGVWDGEQERFSPN